jgi:hypothetical protein
MKHAFSLNDRQTPRASNTYSRTDLERHTTDRTPRVTTRETVPPSRAPTARVPSPAARVPSPAARARGTSRLSIPSIAMRACTAPCHATRAGRHAGASRRPTSSASSVSVVARAVNAGETSGKATEDGKPVPPALTSEVRDLGVTRCARVMRVKGGGANDRPPSHSRVRLARA